MPDFISTAPPELIALLEEWRSHNGTIASGDVSRLEKLLTEPEMETVWSELDSAAAGGMDALKAKLLLIELFQVAQPVPEWERLAPSERQKRLTKTEQRARELRDLLKSSPFQHLSQEALDRMALMPQLAAQVPEVRLVQESDYLVVVDDLLDAVERHRGKSPLLQRPGREDAHRQSFFIEMDHYLTKRFRTGMHRELAVMGRIMLRDPTIDTETVRLTLLNRRNRG